MTESQIQAEILRALGSRPDVRLFRNTCGTGWSGQHISGAGNIVTIGNARFVRYGLTPGSADIVGWQVVTVTPEMVENQRLQREVERLSKSLAQAQKIIEIQKKVAGMYLEESD